MTKANPHHKTYPHGMLRAPNYRNKNKYYVYATSYLHQYLIIVKAMVLSKLFYSVAYRQSISFLEDRPAIGEEGKQEGGGTLRDQVFVY